ncbi:sensor domain-containing protein [Mycobacterium sp. Dal123C01]|uniref:sensor domain-containing protein n=1 Tax=Mycobacterium sp. Dal123C01 TaxID=3457577 RepID=UPI00403E3C96
MRQLPAAVAVAAAGILVTACGGSNGGGTPSSSSTTTTTSSKPPVAQAALPSLLLTLPEVDTALGVTGSKNDKTFETLQEDKTTDVFPKGYKFPAECLYITGEGLTPVYAGSGNTTVHGERDTAAAPASSDPDPEITQFVVLFPTAQQASAFFTTSSQRWPACANRQETVPPEPDGPEIKWKVGPVTNANGVLSTTVSVSLSKGGDSMSQSCQRALTVRNNVVIDTEACRKDPGDAGISVANQIAGKVDKQ